MPDPTSDHINAQFVHDADHDTQGGGCAGIVLPERSSERSMKQLDRFPIDHLHGYPGMEPRRSPALAFVCLGPLDSDVSLPVDDPGEVGECKYEIL